LFTVALLARSLALREKAQPQAWRTCNARSVLGGALLGLRKYDEAEPLLLKGYQGMKQCEEAAPQGRGNDVPDALDRLMQLYAATDNPGVARKYRAERAKYPERLPPPMEEK